MHIKYHMVNNRWYLIACHMATCVIYNENCTRRLFTFEANKSSSNKMAMSNQTAEEAAAMNDVWFTCS